jgi:hypothetical protein|tara:strand:+ start:142 stop:987 length:846 start_codon:yes stop_codon:yes gene_type:complete
MTSQAIRQRADRLRALPLESVLRLSGAQLDHSDPHKWHTLQGILSVNGTKFINWNRGMGGGGAIDLVIHLHRCGFQQALHWLEGHVPAASSPPPPSAIQPNWRLPAPDPNRLPRVRDYLRTQRRLPAALIEGLVQSATLYADDRANAVFLLLGKDNLPVGAELRGTSSRLWRGMAPGSRKDLGFFSIPTAPGNKVILCESAIDAISCFALYPQYRCISTAGARPNPLWLPSLIQETPQVYCGFDADPTGEAMAQAMIALHPTVQRLPPSRHDWNDLLKSPS